MSFVELPEIHQQEGTLLLRGAWITRMLRALPQTLVGSHQKALILDAAAMTEFDTAGALLLNQYLTSLEAQGTHYQFKNLKSEWAKLLQFVRENPPAIPAVLVQEPLSPIAFIGKETLLRLSYFFHFFDFIGRICCVVWRILKQPRRFHLKSIVNTIEQSGINSLPIIGLLCFLIGIVLAYQLGGQLKTYGANIFIVYLTGVAILREFGPLIAAIILAGRTSSAFTAQIGSMKVNQEIDALLTMGLFPSEFLVIPKLIGLLLVFPLLIFWADIFGVLGSMFMARISLNIGYYTFLSQFAHSVELKQLFIGISKAPIFALIIALVGCYQGFQVEYSADSVGSKTTKSVVQAIFLIIIADAAFSIFYSAIGI